MNMDNNKINRRNFLGTGLTATAALTFGSSWAMNGFLGSHMSSTSGSPLKDGVIDKKVLSEGWKIKSIKPGDFTISGISNVGEWLAVPVVPAMPHEILLHHKKIEEP